jgi:hypothetical protein
MENNERLQRFFEICENSPFPHREELLSGIKNGEYFLESKSNSEVPAEQLLGIYEVRAEIIGEKKGFQVERLKNDILSFVEELKKVSNEKVTLWHFSIDEASQFFCFEGISSQKILGCLLTVDKRKFPKVNEKSFGVINKFD